MKIVFALLLAAPCGGGPGAEPEEARADAPAREPVPPSGRPEFSAIYREIIAAESCLLGLCHGEGASGGGLDLDPREQAYDALVGTRASSRACAGLGLARVEPGAPERSLLVLKLSDQPPCGLPMPPDGGLSAAQLEQVAAWIRRGAPDD